MITKQRCPMFGLCALALVLAAACGRKAATPAIHAEVTPERQTREGTGEPAPSAPEAATPPPGADSIAYAPGVALQKLPIAVGAMAAGAPPDASHPLGTLLLSTSDLENHDWTLLEWDPAARRSLRRARFSFSLGPKAIQTAAEQALAKSGNGAVFVTSGYEEPSPLEIWVVDSALRRRARRVMDRNRWDGIRPDLAADERTVVVTTCDNGFVRARSFDARTLAMLGDRRVGTGGQLCTGFRDPIAPVSIVGDEIWLVAPRAKDSLQEHDLVGMTRDLSKELARVALPDSDSYRLDATARGFALSTSDRVLLLDTACRLKSEYFHELPAAVGMDPESGAAFGDDGRWLSRDGRAERRFVPPPLETKSDTPPFPSRAVVWANGRVLVLVSRQPSDYLAIVEPRGD